MIKGCQVIMPETVFFKNGKIDLIYKCDREWCLSQDIKTKTSGFIAIKQTLLPIVDERRRDSTYLGITKAATRPSENKSK